MGEELRAHHPDAPRMMLAREKLKTMQSSLDEVDANDLRTHDLLEVTMESGIGHPQTEHLLAPLLVEKNQVRLKVMGSSSPHLVTAMAYSTTFAADLEGKVDGKVQMYLCVKRHPPKMQSVPLHERCGNGEIEAGKDFDDHGNLLRDGLDT